MNFLKSILLLVLIALSVNLYSQTNIADEDRFFYTGGIEDDFKPVEDSPSFSTKGIQYGVFLTPIYINQKDDNGKLSSVITNVRVWAKSYLWSNSFLYLRGKNSYLGPVSGTDSYEEVETDNVLDLDLAFVSMKNSSGSLNFSLGRKYYNIGSGLVLNGRGDGAEFKFYSGYANVKLLGMYTGLLLKDNNPYGINDKDITDGSERGFFGGTVSSGFYNQSIYAFGLAQMDISDDEDTTKSNYNSQYFGLGIKGVIADITYFSEFIYETGTSYVTSTNEEASIKAYAVNSGISYLIPVMLRPVITVQYAHASGDKDRDSYETSNRASSDSDDKGFMYFGTYAGGYSFKPSLGNLHVFRGGLSFKPFSEVNSIYIKRLNISGKYSYYMKAEKEAAVNGGEGSEAESFVGQGIDLSLKWKIFSDLSFYVNYGIFIPGDAFSSDAETRTFLMTGMNLNF